jgi:hypothetical protein
MLSDDQPSFLFRDVNLPVSGASMVQEGTSDTIRK